MEKRFIDMLESRIEEFQSTGRTEFKKWELLLWHDQQNLSKGIWRSIYSHISSKKPDAKPLIFESWGTYYIFDQNWCDDLSSWID